MKFAILKKTIVLTAMNAKISALYICYYIICINVPLSYKLILVLMIIVISRKSDDFYYVITIGLYLQAPKEQVI